MTNLTKRAPTIYLAWGGGASPKDVDNIAKYLAWEKYERPSMLVSYAYLDDFLSARRTTKFPPLRSLCIDSGAFSAYNKGTKIDIVKYHETCVELKRSCLDLDFVFTLDVIDDHKSSIRNTDWLWARGVEAVPVFHTGEPWDVLEFYAKNFPKLAVGGLAGMVGKRKIEFAKQIFARAWPARIHGLAVGGQKEIRSMPWHSTDAASWMLQPRAYGLWKMFGRLPARESDSTGRRFPLRSQVEWYLRLEREVQQRWAKEMRILDELPTTRTG